MDLSGCMIVWMSIALIPICIGIGAACYSIVENCVKHKSRVFYMNAGYAGMIVSAMFLVGITVYNTRSIKPCGEDSLTKAIKNHPVQIVAALPCGCGN